MREGSGGISVHSAAAQCMCIRMLPLVVSTTRPGPCRLPWHSPHMPPAHNHSRSGVADGVGGQLLPCCLCLAYNATVARLSGLM